MNKRVLIVGYGSIGARHLKNIHTLIPDAEIAILSEHLEVGKRLPEGANLLFKSQAAADKFSPHIVIVANAASLHVATCLEYLKSNVSLFIEKPVSTSFNSGIDLYNQFKFYSGFIMVGYVLRFFPMLHEIRNLIQKNKIGKIYSVQIQVGQYLPDWRPKTDYRVGVSAQSNRGGGVLLELSHEIDYATWLFGVPENLFCSAEHLSELEIDVEDHANLIFEYTQQRKRITLQLDFLQRAPNMEFRITGSEGTLKADLINESVSLFNAKNPDGILLSVPKTENGNEIYLRQFDYLCHKTFSEYIPRYTETSTFVDHVDLKQAAQVLEIVDKAKISNSVGKRTKIEHSIL